MPDPALKHKSPLQLFVKWMIGAVLVVLVGVVIGVNVPASFRKLVLFHALFGAVMGYAFRKLALEIGNSITPLSVLFGSLLIIIAGSQIGRLSYEQFAAHQRGLASKNSDQLAALNMLRQLSQNDAEQLAKYEEARREFDPHFQDYLKMRTRRLGHWDTPWPEVLWGVELLLAGLVGGWVFSRPVQSEHQADQIEST